MNDSITRSEVRKLFNTIQQNGTWEQVKNELMTSTAQELNSATTPEQAFEIAVKYRLIHTIFETVAQKLEA